MPVPPIEPVNAGSVGAEPPRPVRTARDGVDRRFQGIERLLSSLQVQPEDPSFREKVLETVAEGDAVKNQWLPRRPIPEGDVWFETAWAAYREGEIYG